MKTEKIGAARERLEAIGGALQSDTPDPSANGQIAAARMYIGLADQALNNALIHLAALKPSDVSDVEETPNA